MIVERLIILDYENEVANEFSFSQNANIITSDRTTIGKSSLIKSLYYALGFEIKQFPHGWNFNTMRFRVDILIKGSAYSIIRDNTLFYVSDSDGVLSLKEFSEWLEEKLSINMKLKLKKSKTNELSSVYATEILTSFYLDQDKSWNGYIFKNSSDSLGRYSNIPGDILEYVLGISNQGILEKENEKSKNQKKVKQIKSKIEVLNSLQEEYVKNTKMIDTSPYDLKKLKETFNNYLKQLSRISSEISVKKKEIFAKKTKQDLNSQDNVELEKIMTVNKKTYKDVELECIHCHSKLTLEQSLTRLKLKNNLLEIQNMLDFNNKENEKLQNEIEELQNEIAELDSKYSTLSKRKMEIKEILNLKEYIDLESKRLANEEFLKTIDKLSDDRKDLEVLIKTLAKEIRELKEDQKDRKSNISKRFYEILSDINLRLGSTKLSEIEFFNFSEVKGSGMDNNKTLLALYLTYIRLISEYGVYTIPFGIDSFVKNEIDKETVKITFKEVEKYFLSIPSQTFFVTISENLQYLSSLDKYNVIRLKYPILDKENYQKLLSMVRTSNQ
ncbi:hypothetical protein BHT95_18750 [Bacillus paralicheniformis]|uniref:hypothetical protein n=1 Tax=Bacillus TaxID=1386 RepID=UPI000952E23A|nr:hypothetical protein [Bacillus paralicheniformis]MSO00533.1 hypothetical protein [Bacillus paralicheniformis]MSO04541.1 hypothetical protein [Bacillus paralicheniformis]MSO08534.1 hypothetical protein [Bacillus paralicheniformis]MSO12528.1 hypothetical protein [Bacillus paralicheniformis]NJE39162.1 hypothetical protein [Bacillus paralicheniformis]